MTFDEFKVDFLTFLKDSTVNLGRKTTKTRQAFLDVAAAKFDAFASTSIVEDAEEPIVELVESVNPMDDRIVRIKPADKRKALDVGKGVHAMTPSESMRADEQLNRSPFGNNKVKKGKKNG